MKIIYYTLMFGLGPIELVTFKYAVKYKTDDQFFSKIAENPQIKAAEGQENEMEN